MQTKRAFTLIELLVVIAIIAILAAILFPVFAQARAAAKKTASLSNCKQLATAILMYNVDNDDVFPAATNITASIHPFPGRVFPQLRTLVQPYVKNNEIWWNPASDRPDQFETLGVETNLANAVAANGGIGPADDPNFLGAGSSYAFKTRSKTGCPVNSPGNCRGNIAAESATGIENPADVWMFWDADSNYSRHTDRSISDWQGTPTCAFRNAAVRKQMAAFTDGHAKLTSIPRPQWFENMALDGRIYTDFGGCP